MSLQPSRMNHVEKLTVLNSLKGMKVSTPHLQGTLALRTTTLNILRETKKNVDSFRENVQLYLI